jgi:hypothetical protein
MKRLYFIGLLLISACSHFDTRSRQQKTEDMVKHYAEDMVKHYLDSALNGLGNYKIISFGRVDTVFSADLKTDSKQENVKPRIAG